MKNFFKEFKNFALRGSVIDLAIGLIVGAGFNQVVNSLVTNVILPPIGLILGRVDFSSLFINFSGQSYDTLAEAQKAGAPTINYGLFVNSLISFTITAFVVFVVIHWVSKLHKKEPKNSNQKNCPFCYSVIDVRSTRCSSCTASL